MIRMRRSTKYLIVIIIFIISIGIGLKRSNFYGNLSPRQVSVNTSKIDRLFKNASNMKKVEMNYSVSDKSEAIRNLQEMFSENDISPILSEYRKNYFLALFEIQDSLFKEGISALRQIEGLESENSQSTELHLFRMDIVEHLKNKELTRNHLQSLISISTIPERVKQYNIQLEKIQVEIDSLSSQEIIWKHNEEFHLVSVIIKGDINDSNLFLNSLIVFFKTTALTLIILIISLLILYYIMTLLIQLMKVLGIKTSKGSSSYYYYSRDKPSRRKIKRVYKDEDQNKEEKREERNNESK